MSFNTTEYNTITIYLNTVKSSLPLAVYIDMLTNI
jgi:hypothetical protein